MNFLGIIGEFPQALELNSILYDRVCENFYWEPDGNQNRGQGDLRARRTDFNLHKKNFKEVDILLAWIKEILPEVSTKFASENAEEIYHFNQQHFKLVGCWGAHYNRGEGLQKHNHFPYTISFVYYVRTPKGFSPLIIEDENIDVKEGQCVFFLAHQYHSVQPNNCDGRCVIAGNFLYKF